MTSLQRPVFQDGQYLAAADLDAILTYARAVNQARGLGSASWGITSGLELAERAAASGIELWLTPGHAIDGYGNDLIVRSPLPVGPVMLQGKPSGAWFAWLQLKPRGQNQIRPSYGVCDGTEAFARVGEDSEVVVTGLLPLAEQTSGVMLGTGLLADPRLAVRANDPEGAFLLDGSVSWQLSHPAGLKARWLVPLGLVGWDSATRSLRALTDEERKGARLFRRHAGAVAEQVLAPNGLVRITDRLRHGAAGAPDSEADVIAAKAEAQSGDIEVKDGRASFTELLWIDGHSRLRGDARLFAAGIEWRDADGKTKNGAMAARRVSDDGKGSSELVVAIGEPGKLARLVVGPNAAGAAPEAATPVLAVASGGKVGINVREPAIALHINGPFGNLSGEVKAHFGTSTIIGKADGLLLLTSGRNVVQVGENDHMLGINTVPTPGNALDVNGTVQVRGNTGTLRLLGSELIDDGGGNFRIRSGGGFISFDGGDAIAMGHANPNPNYRLDVHGAIAVTSGPARMFLLGSELADENDGILRVRSGGGTVAFDGGDNVAMGHANPNPNYRLDVRGAIGVTGPLAEVFLIGSRIADENDGILRIRSGGGIVAFDGADSVGIGTAAPVASFHVAGSAKVDGFLFYTVLAFASDRRLKKDIAPVEGALARLCKLEAVRFRWKEGEDQSPQYGYVADDVEKVFPELVGAMADGTKFIRNGIDAMQSAAIRELAMKLEAAEQRIAALEAKLATPGKR